jgi:recombination associated protein RdgC
VFKSARIYTITLPATADAAVIESGLLPFVPSSGTQPSAIGFVPPRGEEHGALVEMVDGHYLLKVAVETRNVPANLVRQRAAEEAKEIFAATGRHVGKKQMKVLREDALLALLPAAFPKRVYVGVWIDKSRRRMVVDCGVQSRLDSVITLLIQQITDLIVSNYAPPVSPGAAMMKWLMEPNSLDHGLSLGNTCELRSTDEARSLIRYNRYSAPETDIRRHISEGRLPTRAAFNWADRMTFVMDSYGHLSSLKFEVPPEAHDAPSDFDANAMLLMGTLTEMLKDLDEALT